MENKLIFPSILKSDKDGLSTYVSEADLFILH